MFTILKFLIKIIMRQHFVHGMENIVEPGGNVFVCNHAGSYGPLAMGLFFPLSFRPWVIYRTMTAGLCRNHLEKDLFGSCHPALKPLWRFASLLLEPACIWVMRRIKAIPVYRGKTQIFTTFRLSVEALAKGDNIVIFPEKENSVYSRHLKDFYTGFVHLARKYYREHGKVLAFYPIYISNKKKSITVCKPFIYNPGEIFRIERDRLCCMLMKAIRQTAAKNK